MKYTLTGIVFLVSIFFAVHPAQAATVDYYVNYTSGTDSGPGTSSGAGAWKTIQYALTTVSNPATDSITIHLSGETYTTSNTVLTISRGFTNLTLQGESADTTIIQPSTTPSGSTVRVFDLTTGTNNVTFKNLTVRYGRITSGSGSAIYQGAGTLTITDCNIIDNDGTGSFVSGGVYSSGHVTITNSTFMNNASPLIFTSENWDTPQTVTLTGQDDESDDGDVMYSISFEITSADELYAALVVEDVGVTNTDNDDPAPDPDPTPEEEDDTQSSIIQNAEQSAGSLEVTYEDGETGSFEPFGGSAQFAFAIDPERDAIVATNGRFIRTFVHGEQVSQVVVKKKAGVKKNYRLKVRQLFASYHTVAVLTTTKQRAKVTVYRLRADNTLQKKTVRSFAIANRESIKLKVRPAKKRIITIVGKGNEKTQQVWRLKKSGKLQLLDL